MAEPKKSTEPKAKTAEGEDNEKDGPRLVEVEYEGSNHVVHELTGNEFDKGDVRVMNELEAADLLVRGGGMFSVHEVGTDEAGKKAAGEPEEDPSADEDVVVKYQGALPVVVDGRRIEPGEEWRGARADAEARFAHFRYTVRKAPRQRARG